eukprot:scaffold764_cov408-Prasinococcus_capsulatus_cf.AAC.5
MCGVPPICREICWVRFQAKLSTKIRAAVSPVVLVGDLKRQRSESRYGDRYMAKGWVKLHVQNTGRSPPIG